MASHQCCKSAEQTYGPGQQRQSLGQKVSEMAGWTFKTEETYQGGTETESQTQVLSTKSQTNCCKQTQTNGNKASREKAETQTKLLGLTNCQSGANGTARKGKNKKKGLLEKIKDGFSHHRDSSSSSSSSSSESDSDDEKREERKD